MSSTEHTRPSMRPPELSDIYSAISKSRHVVYLASTAEKKALIRSTIEGLINVEAIRGSGDNTIRDVIAPDLQPLVSYLPKSRSPFYTEDDLPTTRPDGWLSMTARHVEKLSSGLWRAIILSPEDFVLKWPIGTQKSSSNQGVLGESLYSWKVGDFAERQDIIRALNAIGYIFLPRVERPKDASIRGNIIDLFPPHLANPVRVEFDGDQIESMREFDYITQRSIQSLRQLTIYKSAAPFSGRKVSSAALNALADHLVVPSRVRRLLFAQIKSITIEDASSGQLPLWFPEEYDRIFRPISHLWDCRSRADIAFFCDNPETFKKRYDLLFQSLTNQYEHAKGLPELVCSPKDIAASESDVSTSISAIDEVQSQEVSNYDTKTPFALAKQHFSALKMSCQETLGDLDLLASTLKNWRIDKAISAKKTRIILSSNTTRQMETVTALANAVNESTSSIHIVPIKGRFAGDGPLTPSQWLLRTQDIFTSKKQRSFNKSSRYNQAAEILSPTALRAGALVVHRQHGIGRYEGLQTVNAGGIMQDYLKVVYAENNRLYVPAYNIDMLSTYLGGGLVSDVTLDKLGGSTWSKKRQAAKEDIAHLAENLLRVHATRMIASRNAYKIDQTAYSTFANAFPHIETSDQTGAINDLIEDLSTSTPMNRIICGDVGFGKTEVAMRGAFIVAYDGRQVAILAPTTLLSHQHYQSFLTRFKDTGLRIARLCSLDPPKEQKQTVEDIARGKIDIVIGTHRLLSKDIRFKRLGLLVIDEEHRFGVKQKEKLKSRTQIIDQLYLSATPIPRTLQSGLTGLQSISRLTVAPSKRKRIHTRIIDRKDKTIQHILSSELRRGGQVYVVHNRVRDIKRFATYIEGLAPASRLGIVHGQLDSKKVESIMVDFINRDLDILVATTIIESGIDIDSANTMIVNNAHQFGLSQLHQLRGRIGRSETQAFCYLICSDIRKEAEENKKKSAYARLIQLTKHESLGSGHAIALQDLEARGAGDILGAKQSGHIAKIGYQTFMTMLSNAADTLRANQSSDEDQTHSNAGNMSTNDIDFQVDVPAYIPDTYMSEVLDRVAYYQRISHAAFEDLSTIAEEIEDIFGTLPTPISNLFETTRVKAHCRFLPVDKLVISKDTTILYFTPSGIQSMQPDHLRTLQRNAISIGPCGWKIISPDVSAKLNKPDAGKSTKSVTMEDIPIDLAAIHNLIGQLYGSDSRNQ